MFIAYMCEGQDVISARYKAVKSTVPYLQQNFTEITILILRQEQQNFYTRPTYGKSLKTCVLLVSQKHRGVRGAYACPPLFCTDMFVSGNNHVLVVLTSLVHLCNSSQVLYILVCAAQCYFLYSATTVATCQGKWILWWFYASHLMQCF